MRKLQSFRLLCYLLFAIHLFLLNGVQAQPTLPVKDSAQADLNSCAIKLLARATFYVAIKQYADLEGISINAQSLKALQDSIKEIIFNDKNNAKNDIIKLNTLDKNILPEFIDTNSAADLLGLMGICQRYMDIFKDLKCSKKILDTLPLNNWNIFLKNEMIYAESSQGNWQADDRADFQIIDKILVSHFDLTARKNARKYGKIYRNWQSSVMVIHASYIDSSHTDSTILIKTTKLKDLCVDNKSVCDNVVFASQDVFPARGTGVFVQNNTIATVAHLFGPEAQQCDKRDISMYRFIRRVNMPFEYAADGSIIIHKRNVFRPVPGKNYIPEGRCFQGINDWALVEVEPIRGTAVDKLPNIKITLNKQVSTKKSSVYCFGHGLGLPLKFAFDATLTASGNPKTPDYLWAKLDMFAGNSGSPVFDSESGDLVGLLIGGEADFVEKQGCMQYAVLDAKSNDAELIQGIRPIAQALGVIAKDSTPKVVKMNKKALKPQLNKADTCTINSISRIVTERTLAPYTFLYKFNQNKHVVGLMVPFADSMSRLELVGGAIGNTQNPILTYNVVQSNTKVSNYGVDTLHFNGLDVNATIEIRITKSSDTLVTKLRAGEAESDTVDYYDGYFVNAPYGYLEVTKTDRSLYLPYLLVPTRTYSNINEIAECVDTTSFRTTVEIIGYIPSGGISIYKASSTNQSEYRDSSIGNNNGYYYLKVVDKKNKDPKDSKTTHPNMNANPKPLRIKKC